MAVRLTRYLTSLKKPENCRQLLISSCRHQSDIKFADLKFTPTATPLSKPASDAELVFGETLSDHMLVIEWNKKNGWNAPHIVPSGPLPMNPSISALHYGLSCFEGLKAYRTKDGTVQMFRPDENMERFHNSSTRLSLPPFHKGELLRCISELVRIEQDWIPASNTSSLYIRPVLFSTEPSLGVRAPNNAMLVVLTGPVGAYYSTGTFQPVSLLADSRFVRAWPGGIGDCKASGNYAPTIHALKIAESKGCSQCLWLYNGEVTEVGTMNIFMYWINEGGERELVTPALNGLILPGVTRKSLLELARDWGEFKVSERSFTIDELEKAASEGRVKEIFGAGTACVVCPVSDILYNDKYICLDVSNGFPIAERFYKELTDIQFGQKDHRWLHVVDSPHKATR